MVDLSRYKEIIIWGACFPADEIEGEVTSIGRAINKLFELLDIHGYADKVIFIVDSNKKLHGKKRLGKEVKSPLEIKQYPNALIIINTISIQAVQKSLKDMDINNDYMIIPYYWYHGTMNHPYVNEFAKKHIEKYKTEIEDLFYIDDPKTKQYLDIIFSLREKNEDDLYTPDFYAQTVEYIAYFCDTDLAPKWGDVTYIDVGAYTGDSIESVKNFYGERLKKCIAFEPNTNSINSLKSYLYKNNLSERTKILPYALGSESKTIYFSQAGHFSQVSDTDGKDKIALAQKAFDELSDIDIIGEAMLKMDIEGSELDALQGMQSFIKKYQPYLAICLYHKEADLYDIPHYLKTLYPGYRLYLRGGWHLECWAVPERHFNSF